MPRIGHQTLRWVTVAAALIGQFMLDANPQPAILLCGIALAAELLDGWWYPIPIGSGWWYPALLGGLGLTMWNQPRGWFFLAWAAIEVGTGLRAKSIWQSYEAMLAAERARVAKLRAKGFDPQTELPDEEPPDAQPPDEQPPDEQPPGEPPPAEPAAPPAPLPPIPWWRYALALLLGLLAAWFGAWCTRIAFHLTSWQLDILAYFIGYMVGKAVVAGAGNRTNRFLQVVAALLGGGGVLYGRYLLLRFIFFEQFDKAYSVSGVVSQALQTPGTALGLWLLLFVALGTWTGWQYARVVDQRR